MSGTDARGLSRVSEIDMDIGCFLNGLEAKICGSMGTQINTHFKLYFLQTFQESMNGSLYFVEPKQIFK